MVKDFLAKNDVALIKRLTAVLTTEFSVSHNPHSRKGGLIGLAATAIALGKVGCLDQFALLNTFQAGVKVPLPLIHAIDPLFSINNILGICCLP